MLVGRGVVMGLLLGLGQLLLLFQYPPGSSGALLAGNPSSSVLLY